MKIEFTNNWKCFALLAALFNASIGIFSKTIFSMGTLPSQVAFYKCLMAFLLLTIIHLFIKNGLQKLKQHRSDWWKIAICSFFGIFTLYFFETSAYSHTMVSTVVFVLLGSSTATTFLMSYFILKEQMTIFNLFSFTLCLLGLFYLFNGYDLHLLSIGTVLAMIAGMGYGLFLSLTKKLNVNTQGLSFLWWFLGFGTLYLSIPVITNPLSIPSFSSLPSLIFLSLVPTIGGYFCTAKALTYGDASQVQVFELTEPLFASLMGFMFFGELLKGLQVLGAICILLAIFISSHSFNILIKRYKKIY